MTLGGVELTFISNLATKEWPGKRCEEKFSIVEGLRGGAGGSGEAQGHLWRH